jgi:hypothetical protein
MPPVGMMFSASMGTTLEESAAGVKHGMIRVATVGQIRRSGGEVVAAPEIDPRVGIMNRRHVHVVERGDASVFGPPQPNPVPKLERFGGRDFVDRPVPWAGDAP